jgi:hypothetical protein
MPVTDPHGGFQRDAHVFQSEVKLAGVNPAMPHHDAVTRNTHHDAYDSFLFGIGRQRYP